MSDTLYWSKKYLRQLQQRWFGENVNRDKNYVIDNYTKTGTRDLDLYFNETQNRCVFDGQLTTRSAKEVRDFYIDTLAEQIKSSGAKRILEVGCGTSLNIYLLSQRFPEIHFEGIDITPERLEVGKKWLKAEKNFVPNVHVGDATQLAYEDDAFDIIYTVHCFEQIDQYALAGTKEACRVAKKKVVFLEPDYGSSNAAQRLFLKNHNYLVDFAQTIKSVAPGKLDHKPLDTYYNLMNRTGLFVVNMS